jgi:probable F420-dependent oxidoreductase
MTLRLGVFLAQNGSFPPHGVVESARAAEDIGFDSVWVFERVLYAQDQTGIHRLTEYGDGTWPPVYRGVLDPIVALSMAVAATSRVRVGTAVVLPPLHMPFRLAKSLASIAAASGGRLIAGLGSGWSIDEFEATAPRPITQRGAALDEFLDVAEAVWGPDPVSFKNERYHVYPAEVGPKPGDPIPILLAAFASKALDRVARRADGWLPVMMPPAQIASTLRGLRDKAAEYGRNPDDLSCTTVVSHGPFVEVPSADRQPYTGSIDQVLGDLADLADAGVTEVALTVSSIARDLAEWHDLAAEFHSRFAAAGI